VITHLARGLAILGERWWSGPWIAEAEGPVDLWARRGLRAVLTIVVFRVACASRWLFAAAVLMVIVRALRVATKAAKEQPKKTPGAPTEEHQEDAGSGLPEVSPQEFLELLYDAMGTARGVHLRTLAAALIHRVGGAWDIADVRRLCAAARVPVTPTVRAPGGKPTVGVYRADLPPLPDPSPAAAVVPEVGVVVAGQPGTTPPTTPAPTTPTTPTVTTQRGVHVIARDDPDNPARTHVTVVSTNRKGA
jgi:hypothetical protein